MAPSSLLGVCVEEEQASLHKPIPSALEFGTFVIPFTVNPSLHFNQVFVLPLPKELCELSHLRTLDN